MAAADVPDDAVGEALVAEATKKAGLVWLTVPGAGRARAAWHVWHEGAAYVVSGGAEQPLPGLAEAGEVTVTVPSKDNRARLVTWVASVAAVAPDSDEWDAVTAALKGARLNARDGEQQPQRWATESAVTRLTPTGRLTERPGDLPDASLAATPAPTAATTRGPLPRMLGRRPRRRNRRRD